MRINDFEVPHSSFLSVEKDTNLIMEKIWTNKRIQKLLYYPTQDCLDKPNLTDEQKYSLYGKQIKNIPKIVVDNAVKTYMIVNFDNFLPNSKNPEFRDNMIEFDIICHYDQWQLKDFALRPYRIAAEIDVMLKDQRLTGIGTLHFAGASKLILTDEYAGLCIIYKAIHGGEDEVGFVNPEDEAKMMEDFFSING